MSDERLYGDYLSDMLENMEIALRFIKGIDKDKFLNDQEGC